MAQTRREGEKTMRTIRVTGRGQLKVHPDRTRITMELDGVWPEYAETLKRSSKDTEQLKDLLSEYGFARTDIKTLDFHIDPEYESYKEKCVFKQRLIGYRYTHVLKIEFDSDRERLANLLFALSHCPSEPEIRISYTVSNPDAVKNTLIGKAVTDAREKASVLTQAAGVALKEIQSIDYSWGEVNIECFPMRKNLLKEDGVAYCAETAADYNLDMEPDDAEVSDTVTVIWEIG